MTECCHDMAIYVNNLLIEKIEYLNRKPKYLIRKSVYRNLRHTDIICELVFCPFCGAQV